MSSFIAVLDREHLENKIFLTSFAKALSRLQGHKGIILHGDSEYTERLIQTGMMRKDARERAIKDLNRRLIGLLADQGVPTVGVNGYQKNLVQVTEDQKLKLDTQQLNSLPDVPCVLVSSLVQAPGTTKYIPLPEFASLFNQNLKEHRLILFSQNEKDEILISNKTQKMKWEELDQDTLQETVPDEFRAFREPVILASATDFSNWPDLKNHTELH